MHAERQTMTETETGQWGLIMKMCNVMSKQARVDVMCLFFTVLQKWWLWVFWSLGGWHASVYYVAR
jgi:hypothetical protein